LSATARECYRNAVTKNPQTALAREYPVGTVLFEERDPGSRMYVIRSGKVKIYRHLEGKEIVLAFLSPGDFFGEMALLENLPRSASAMVVEQAMLVEVDAETFEEMIRRNIEIAVRIMRKLAQRVRELDTRMEKLLVDTAQGRALEVLRWLLPQGLLDGDWVRVHGAAAHLDIVAQAGIPAPQAEGVMRRLKEAGLVAIDGEDLLIAQKDTLDTFAHYLELKRRYGLALEDVESETPSLESSMRRLMGALKLNDHEVNARQKHLANQYSRYIELQKRFRDVGET
jgi:CRP/FNR family transcriptional regulator, cyclic AMP receptor protein